MSNKVRREVLIFGATGGTGIEIVHAALGRNCSVSAFVRDSARASQLLNGPHASLHLLTGDATDAAQVQRAVGATVDAVIVTLGIYQRRPGGDDLARATAHIIAAMHAAGPTRLICISSLGVGDSRNQGNFAARMIQKTALRFTLADKELQEQAIRASGLDWTIIRPSRLVNDGGPPHFYRWSGRQPKAKLVWAINRAQVAALALDCLDDRQTIHKAINVTGSLTMQGSSA